MGIECEGCHAIISGDDLFWECFLKEAHTQKTVDPEFFEDPVVIFCDSCFAEILSSHRK